MVKGTVLGQLEDRLWGRWQRSLTGLRRSLETDVTCVKH